MTLSRFSRPSIRSCAPAASRDLNRRCASAGYSVLVINDDLPEPETPVTHTSMPSGISTSMFFRLFSRAPTMRTRLPLPRCRWRGTVDGQRAAEELARQRLGRGHDALDRALGHDASAVFARAWAHVDDPVGRAHRVLVVLDHDQGVAQIAQPHAACAIRRALSRWCRPMLGSSRMYSTPIRPEPICVASRIRWASPPDKRGGGSAQRQVVEADVDQEAQPFADLLQDLAADGELAIGQRQVAFVANADASLTGSLRDSSNGTPLLERGEELARVQDRVVRRPRGWIGQRS